tara:strand:- start:38 stop:256 length:219 start_codon:yes stop_codon:yes gene_type:complete
VNKKIKLKRGDLILNVKSGNHFILLSRFKEDGRYFWKTLSKNLESQAFYEKNLRHKLIKEGAVWHLIKKMPS